MADARRILIDGRSGSGKTELARAIAADWPEAQLVRMDDLYPGWDGLAAGSGLVPSVLTTGRYRVWDWSAGRYGEERVLDLGRPIIVEGVGALSRASRPLADFAVGGEYPAQGSQDAGSDPRWCRLRGPLGRLGGAGGRVPARGAASSAG